MSKVGTVKTVIEEEYDVCYKKLADELIEHNKGIFTEAILKQLVEKYSQQLSRLKVVFYDNNIMNVALMYYLGDNIFFRHSCFYPSDGFYICSETVGTPAVEKVNPRLSMKAIKDCVLKWLTEDRREEIYVHPHLNNHWVFKCQYSIDNTESDAPGETFFEVVIANDFVEATRLLLLRKLVGLKDAITFSNFEFWQNESFVKLSIARVSSRREPVLIEFIDRLDITSNEFIFIICP